MALTLPTRTDLPHYQFETELDEVSVVFEFYWNGREGAWHFHLLELDGTPILRGRKVVLNYPLLHRFADARLPAGELIAFDTSGTLAEPDFDELGSRVVLVYHTAAEVAAGG